MRSLLLAKFSLVWPLPDRKVPIQVGNTVLKQKENETETGNQVATQLSLISLVDISFITEKV